MKILLWPLIGLLFLGGCLGQNKKQIRPKITPFNLFDRNREIPEICKPPYATEENKISFVHFRGRVNRCVDIVNSTPDLNRFPEVKDCLAEIGEEFRAVPDQDCKATVLFHDVEGSAPDIMNFIINRYYLAHVVVTSGNQTNFVWEELTAYFSLVSNWFHQTRDSMYPTSGTQIFSNLQAKDFEENILKRLWDDIQAYSPEWKETFGEIVQPISPTNPDGTPRTPAEIQALRVAKNQQFEIFKAHLAVNQKVIDAAVASELSLDTTVWSANVGTPAPSPILANIMGDALAPFMQRARVVAKIYDIACKLKTCPEDFYTSNKVFWLLKYFDAIVRDTAQTPIDFGDDEDNLPFPVFLTLLHNHREVIKKLARTTALVFQVNDIATSVAGDDFPSYLRSFKKVFEESHDMINNYDKTKQDLITGEVRAGLLTSNRVSEVNVGFSKTNMDRHIISVKNANDKLKELRDRFTNDKHTLIQDVLNINASLIRLRDLETEINLDVTEMAQRKNEIDAIRSYLSEERKTFAEKVLSIINDPSIQSSDRQFFAHPPVYTPAPANATAVGDGQTLEGIVLANLDPGHQFKKGDMLQVSVSGEWSPTCAIASKYGSRVINSRTGPRGYTLITSNGVSSVQSTTNYKTEESFSSTSVSTTACAGVSTYNTFVIANVQTCVNATFGNRTAKGTTDSTTESSDSRTEASFDLGVTLPNTPYPSLPAGSLLLIEVPRDTNQRYLLRRAVVLREQNSLILGRDDSDYYLVGNDCSSVANTGELTVALTHLEPQGLQAQNFVNKVQALILEMENQVAGLIREGQLNFQVIEGLKLQLRALAGDINQFSGQMRNLLESFITSETNALWFKSQIAVMERDLEIKKIKLLGLLEQFGGEEDQHFLRVNLRNWLLSNMDLDFVNKPDVNKNLYTLNRILNILESNLVSYIDFKYRNEDKQFILGDLSLLQNLDLADSFDQISSNIATYVTTLLDNLQADLDNRPVVPKTTIGIKIPNPYYEPVLPIPFPLPGLHPVMESARARDFWDNLIHWKDATDPREVRIELFVDDLYTSYGLECFTEAPIIESMGVFFIPESEGFIADFNNAYRHQNMKLFLEGTSTIPFEQQPRVYNFVNDSWRYLDSAVRMAKSDNDALRMLTEEFPPEREVETGLGTGRPLFGRFKVGSLKPYRVLNGEVYIGETPLKLIKELYIGYVISASNANFNVNLNWIQHCAANLLY
ncbi:MAG: hypothetical protein HYV97_16615 [Bdellovibrio sp.]|nr:hypothetical protein [Bdellovibrio sp.]